MLIYVYVYACTYAYIYIYIITIVHLYIYIQGEREREREKKNVSMYVCMYVCMHVCMYVYIYIYTYIYIYVEGTFTYRMTGFENFYILTCDMCMLWSTGLAQFSTTTKAFPKFKRCLPTSEAGCIRTHLQVFNGAQCTCSLSFIALISVPWSALCTFLNFVMQRCLPTSEQGLYQNPPTSPEWCALHAHKPLGWCLGLHLALS